MTLALANTLIGLGGLILSTIALFWIKTVHIAVNSRMDEFLKLRGEASKAEGIAEERASAEQREK